jgi:pimeloyl-ACP methyl ester carboxylesterase
MQPASEHPLLQPGWREAVRPVNGLDLHVVEAGRPGNPLLVLLHGFPEFWWGWRHQITPLADAGYHVVVPDLRGYNLSSAPQEVAAYDLDTLTRDVLGLADAHGAALFDLVGHDWGAVISWSVAARHPDRVGRLVVLDGPHPSTLGRSALTHPMQVVRSAYAGLFQLPWIPEVALRAFGFAGLRASMQRTSRLGTFTDEDLDRYVAAWNHPGSLTAMLNYYRALRRRRLETPARIVPPTLVLWGEDDSFLGRHVAEQALARCDDGQLVVIEDATHWLHLEESEQVNAEILRFLGPADA